MEEIEKTYYLLGKYVSDAYGEGGIKQVIAETDESDYSIFIFEEEITRSSHFAAALQGNEGFCIITEVEYIKLIESYEDGYLSDNQKAIERLTIRNIETIEQDGTVFIVVDGVELELSKDEIISQAREYDELEF
tara:strand:+ start:496 stop:897 length:402 start_codon:yes stop_codon:yes gene_type:complete